MDEKIIDYVLETSFNMGKCQQGVDAVMVAMGKQMKINKKQKMTNFILGYMVASALNEVVTLKKYIAKQNELIKTLVNATEVTKDKKKGE